MDTNYVEVAQKVMNEIEEIREGFKPHYHEGWKVCRYGDYLAINLVHNYPLISELIKISEELKKLSNDRYSSSQSTVSGTIKFIAVILQLFSDPDETVKIYKGEKDCCYNYNYHACGSNGGDYIVARDTYGTDCLRAPSGYSYEDIIKIKKQEQDEAATLKEI